MEGTRVLNKERKDTHELYIEKMGKLRLHKSWIKIIILTENIYASSAVVGSLYISKKQREQKCSI